MDIKKSASFLKRKIDSFSCNLIIHSEEVIGLEALRYWLRNNYRTSPIKSEIYVSFRRPFFNVFSKNKFPFCFRGNFLTSLSRNSFREFMPFHKKFDIICSKYE